MPKRKKADTTRKMSDIMKEMLERLLLDPQAAHSSQAVYVGLFFANLYGLVHGGLDGEAVRFLKKTRKMSAVEARMMVAKVARDLGMS
jgi:hypothetical protein